MNWKKKKDNPEAQAPEAAAAGKGPAAFWKKNWKLLVPAVCVIVAGGAFLLWPKQAKPASVDASYTEAAPEYRNVSNTLSGTGTLNPANTYTVKSLVDGKVLTSTMEEGDTVDEGTVLYTIDSSDASTNFEKAEIAMQQAQRSYDKVVDRQYVRAEVAGTVSSLKVNKGDEVTSGQEVAVIRDSSKMLLTLEFPAADAANFSVGQSADVTLDGTFEQLTGTVTSVTGTDALSAGNLLTRTVTIAVRNAGGLTTAQAAVAQVNGVSSLNSAHFTYQREETVVAAASGTVSELCVKEGSTVRQDDVILRITGKDLDKQTRNAADSLLAAELQMSSAEKTISHYTIDAPISGTIVDKKVKAGDKLSANDTAMQNLCTIYDMSYLEMKLNVDELKIRSLEVGQEVDITADAVPGETYKGVISSILVAGTTANGSTSYPVTVRIDDMGELLPGMNATAKITTASVKNVLALPNAANAETSMTAPDGYVYVKVTTGISDDDYIEVKSGLQEGDTIAYDNSSVSATDFYSNMMASAEGDDE